VIVAFDFDGVLCEDRFPEIGREYPDAVGLARRLSAEGHEVILWTSRSGRRLVEALEWCDRRGIGFCAVNDNAPSNKARWSAEYPDPPRKVYADLYLEDHCPFFQHYAEGDPEWAVRRMVDKAVRYVDRYGEIWDVKETDDEQL
jgi:hypothetical protein